MSARRVQGRCASSEQRCFEIMNMNDKHSYSLLMRLVDFSAEKIFLQNFQRKKFFKIFFHKFFSPEFSAEKFFKIFFQKFFSPEFSAEKFFKIFFQKFFSPEFSAEKIFQNFFSKIFFSRIFSGKCFHNFFLQNFQRNIFSASLSGIQELNLSGYPFHLTKAFFFFWSRRITFSIRKIF